MKFSLTKTLRGALALLLAVCLALGTAAPAFAEELELPSDDDRLNQLLQNVQELMNKYGPEVDPRVEAGTQKGTDIFYKPADGDLYVAIGDDSTQKNKAYTNYAQLLGEALEIECNLQSGKKLLIEESIEKIITPQQELIKDAELVSLSFSINGFALMAIDELLRKPNVPTALDWSLYVQDEAGRAEIQQTLADIEQYLIDAGLGENLPALLMPTPTSKAKAVTAAAEAFAFGTIAYSNWLPKVVDEIHKHNPDAVVVIIGMDNPMDGTILSVGAESMDMGTYVEKLIQMTNQVSQTAAIQKKNTVFVPAGDAHNANDNAEMTENSLLLTYIGLNRAGNPNANAMKALPDQEGHEYIKNQVLASFRDRMWGDVNGDDKINFMDAVSALRHGVKLVTLDTSAAAVADVDGNGTINYMDAVLILRRAVKLIDEFPVEK